MNKWLSILTAAALPALAAPVSAQTALPIAVPVVSEWKSACNVVNGQMHTMSVQMEWGQAPLTAVYELKFTNAMGQDTKFYIAATDAAPNTYFLPQNSYTLTTSIVGTMNPNATVPLPNTAQVIYRHIVVGVPVPMNGGASCVIQ
jgi:hypothetical protein